MAEDGAHLHASVLEALTLSDEERIAWIRSPRWIGYGRASRVLGCMEGLFTHPRTHRMPNLIIVGDTNNGKTVLLQRFVAQHLADDNTGGEAVSVPVLYIEAPNVPDEGRLYDRILEAFYALSRPSDHTSRKQLQVVRLLRQMGLRLLVIDEIQHLLAGTPMKQRQILNAIKQLGNDLQIPIVAAGTMDAAQVLQSDPQLRNRFEPFVLPRWKLDREFRQLLASFEELIPLRRASLLAERTMTVRLHALCEGLIGELSQLLVRAAIEAVESGVERVDEEVLRALDWASPSERRKRLEIAG